MKKLTKQEWKKIDILFLILSPIFAAVVSLVLQTSFFLSTLLFFGLPSIYLSFRTKQAVKKTFLASFLFAIPGTLFLDFLGIINQAWYVPSTVFSFRFFGIIPVEDILWGFLLTYLVIILYEHYLDKGRHNLKISEIKYLFLFFIIVLLVFFTLLPINQAFLKIPYYYLNVILVLFLLPSIIFLKFFPKLFSKFIVITIYMFSLSFIFELTGLSLKQWEFPSTEFIGYIQIFNYRFPLEEFISWFILFSITTLSYYEFLADDRK